MPFVPHTDLYNLELKSGTMAWETIQKYAFELPDCSTHVRASVLISLRSCKCAPTLGLPNDIIDTGQKLGDTERPARTAPHHVTTTGYEFLQGEFTGVHVQRVP